MCQASTYSKSTDLLQWLFYPTADVIAQEHVGPQCRSTQQGWNCPRN